ncbi:MAG: diphosphomevalonate decarboxylase, partial [Thermoplasmata archaeon]|nr:diphosphomevalonate decarboxylase [Thermoplasmata archaeon]
ADRFVLNGQLTTGRPLQNVSDLLDRIRAESGLTERAHVRSINNFQTASGLASSASGFAALAGAAAFAAGLDPTPQHLSQLARFGSGSACRSIFGGFVEWDRGRRADGRDCFAEPIAPETHWPELVDVVALVRGAPTKSVRSAKAMQLSVSTSPGFDQRQRELPRRLGAIRRAILARDPANLFPLIIEECDSFREVCETTRPSLDYLTATSRAILEAVRQLNRASGRPVAGYTHDAGAHVHVFTLAGDAPRLRRELAGIPGVERLLTLRAGPGGRRLPGHSSTLRSS